eukprot:1141928-Alexandrium_andersonii.AAC.1
MLPQLLLRRPRRPQARQQRQQHHAAPGHLKLRARAGVGGRPLARSLRNSARGLRRSLRCTHGWRGPRRPSWNHAAETRMAEFRVSR